MRRRVFPLAIAPLAIAGCATVPDESPAHPAPQTPVHSAEHEPRQLWLAVASPTDADANGYADTFQVIVYIFPDREVSAIPVWAKGSFEFELTTPDGEPIDRWYFGVEASERARQRLAPGPGFSFFLRLAGDSDVREPVAASLTASFVSDRTGERLNGNGAASVRLGGR